MISLMNSLWCRFHLWSPPHVLLSGSLVSLAVGFVIISFNSFNVDDLILPVLDGICTAAGIGIENVYSASVQLIFRFEQWKQIVPMHSSTWKDGLLFHGIWKHDNGSEIAFSILPDVICGKYGSHFYPFRWNCTGCIYFSDNHNNSYNSSTVESACEQSRFTILQFPSYSSFLNNSRNLRYHLKNPPPDVHCSGDYLETSTPTDAYDSDFVPNEEMARYNLRFAALLLTFTSIFHLFAAAFADNFG
ncbi:hypothetical protein T4C_13451 [Trichinella pseudospiralis]|nr:hypothetical protein T4C_13451 [Trichinella pseudospiralis]